LRRKFGRKGGFGYFEPELSKLCVEKHLGGNKAVMFRPYWVREMPLTRKIFGGIISLKLGRGSFWAGGGRD